MKKFTKFASFLTVAGVLAIGASSLAGCNFGQQADGDLSRPIEPGSYTGLDSVEAVYGFGAVTTAKLLSETGASPVAAAALSDEILPETDPAGGTEAQPETDPTGGTQPDYGLGSGEGADKAQEQAEDFNRYFNMLDDFLDKASVKTTVTPNPVTEGELAAYAFKLEVTGADERGNPVTRTMYYSETELTASRGRDDFDDDDDDDDDDFDFGEEETYKGFALEGVLEMGTDAEGAPVYYFLSGERSETTEKDGRESETQSELWIRASAVKGDTRNCVTMEQESETEDEGGISETETGYTYTVYENGRVAERTEVSLEQEGAKAEYELEFLTGTSRGYYEIERVERAGSKWISVEYLIDGTRGKFVIVQNQDGSYTYKFSSDSAQDRNFLNFAG